MYSSTSARASRVSTASVLQRRDLDLDVEVAGVREDRAVLHALEVRAGDDVLVAGRGAEDVADLGRALHRHDLEAVHRGLERAQRVDLGDDHVRAHPPRARRDAAPDPAVPGDDEATAREQDVRRADDPVDRRLAGAVAVVEHVLRLRLVDRDHREAELPLALERLQPDDAGGRLLRARDHVAELLAPRRVEDADDVGAVVHRQVRPVVDRGLDVLVVRVVVLALDREDGDVVLLDQRRRDVVLGGERVGRAEDDVRAARLQRAGEVRRLGGHVQAGGDPLPGERLLALEALPDRGQHRHLPVGPLDPADAFGGERQVLHVVAVVSLPSVLSRSRSGCQAASRVSSRRSCLRCSHSTHAGVVFSSAGTAVPASQVSTAARTAGSRRSLSANAISVSSTPMRAAKLRERVQLVQLADAVAAVARGGAAGNDQALALEIPQHARRPAGAAARLADGDVVHARQPYHDRVKVGAAARGAAPASSG